MIHVNRYGNCVLNIVESEIFHRSRLPKRFIVSSGSQELCKLALAQTFSEVSAGQYLLYPDSYGRVGIATNTGNFAAMFGLDLGSRLTLTSVHEENN